MLLFVTRYTDNARDSQYILKKNWKILENDTNLKEDIGLNPVVIYKRSRTLKEILALSYPNLNRDKTKKIDNEGKKVRGAYKCGHRNSKCCISIMNGRKELVQ